MSQFSLSPRTACSYDGQKAVPTRDDEVVFVAANAMALVNTESGSQRLLPSRSTGGISAMASIWTHRAIAYSPRSVTPDVVIVRHPALPDGLGGQLISTLAGATELEIADIAVSRDGSHALAVGTLPDFGLAVWNDYWRLEEDGAPRRHSPLARCRMPFACSWGSFNPGNPRQLCTGGADGLAVYNLETHHKHTKLRHTRWPVAEEGEEPRPHMALGSGPFGHCWTPEGNLWVANAQGSLVLVAPPSQNADQTGGAPLATLSLPGGAAVSSVVFTLDRMGAGTRDGRIFWYARESVGAGAGAGAAVPEEVEEGAAGGGGAITCLVATPSHEHLVVGSDGGALRVSPLPTPAGLEANTDDEPPELPPPVQLMSAHADFVTGCAHVRLQGVEQSMVATASLDGSVMVRAADADSAAAPLCSRSFQREVVAGARTADPIVCMDNRGEQPLLALGCASGALRLVALTAKHSQYELLLSHSCKLAHSSISHVCFHPQLPLLAAASVDDGTVFITSLRATADIEVLSVATIPSSVAAEGNDGGGGGGGDVIMALEWAGGSPTLLVSTGTSAAAVYELNASEDAAAAESGGVDADAEPRRLEPRLVAQFEDAQQQPLPPTVMMHGGSLFGAKAGAAASSVLATCAGSRWLALFDIGGANASDPLVPVAEFGSTDGGDMSVDGSGTAPHAAPITAAAALPGCKAHSTGQEALLATGGADGRVLLWSLQRNAPNGVGAARMRASVIASKAAHGHAVLSLRFVVDKGGALRLVSTGIFGEVWIWQLSLPDDAVVPQGGGEAKLPLSQFASRSFQLTADAAVHKEGAEEPAYHEVRAARAAAAAEVKDRKVRDSTLEKVEGLAQQLKTLMDRNARAPELERMTPDEFVIDAAGVASHRSQSEREAEEGRAQLVRRNDELEIVTSRTRELCWDSMLTPAKQLYSMADAADKPGEAALAVDNFAQPRVSAQEEQQLAHVLRQRQVEILEKGAGRAGADAWGDELKAMPDRAPWLVGAASSSAAPAGASGEGAAEGEGGEGEGGDATAEEAKGPGGESGEAGALPTTARGCLYHPCAVRTAVQRRRQQLMLRAVVAEEKAKFNDKFEEVMALKRREMDEILSRNERVVEILKELGREPEHHVPRWRDLEEPETVLEVTEAELKTEVYITAAMKEQQRREEEERRRREEEAKKDDVGGRALMDMMGGTLEVKNEADALKDDLVREDWMDEVPPEKMTDEQKAALEEYEQKVAIVAAAAEKERKALELELKKLLTEIEDKQRSFDEKAEKLAASRDGAEAAIAALELASCRLQMALSANNADHEAVARGEAKLAQMQGSRDELAEHVRDCEDACEAKRAETSRHQARDKELEKGFKSSVSKPPFSVQDQSTVKALLEMFRLRKGAGSGHDGSTEFGDSTMPPSATGTQLPPTIEGKVAAAAADVSRNSSNASRKRPSFSRRTSVSKFAAAVQSASFVSRSRRSGSNAGTVEEVRLAVPDAQRRVYSSPRDPFLQAGRAAETKAAAAAVPSINSIARLDPEQDVPPEVPLDHDLFVHVDELCVAKIHQENLVAAALSDQRDAQQLLNKAQAALDDLDRRMGAVRDAVEDARGRIARSAQNLQLLALTKQGQQEVDAAAHGTDFSEALLCHKSVVDAANALIGKHGDEKVAIMTRIQNFRKSINYMQWEHGSQAFKARGLEEHYTDLQLTKVTKFLQKFIKGGQRGDQQKNEIEKCDAKLEHMKTAQRARLHKLQQKCTRLDRQHRDKTGENDKLTAQISQLEANVKMREEIYKSRFEGGAAAAADGAAEAAAQAQQRMRTITMRRKLIDLARAQTDEIEFLRQELDRLRQRTFPSFAHAGKNAQGPDEL